MGKPGDEGSGSRIQVHHFLTAVFRVDQWIVCGDDFVSADVTRICSSLKWAGCCCVHPNTGLIQLCFRRSHLTIISLDPRAVRGVATLVDFRFDFEKAVGGIHKERTMCFEGSTWNHVTGILIQLQHWSRTGSGRKKTGKDSRKNGVLHAYLIK